MPRLLFYSGGDTQTLSVSLLFPCLLQLKTLMARHLQEIKETPLIPLNP